MTDTTTATRLAEWAAVADATLPAELAAAADGDAVDEETDPWAVDGRHA